MTQLAVIRTGRHGAGTVLKSIFTLLERSCRKQMREWRAFSWLPSCFGSPKYDSILTASLLPAPVKQALMYVSQLRLEMSEKRGSEEHRHAPPSSELSGSPRKEEAWKCTLLFLHSSQFPILRYERDTETLGMGADREKWKTDVGGAWPR